VAWWRKTKEEKEAEPAAEKKSVARGVFAKCEGCDEIIVADDLAENMRVCPKCDFHFTLPTADRIAMVVDSGTWQERDEELEPGDPLSFRDSKKYRDRARAATRSAGAREAYRWGTGKVDGLEAALGFFVFEYMGGSMGSVVGEKIARQIEAAHDLRLPAVIFSASGGARMQEGILSLMQLPRTTVAVDMLKEAGQPYIVVLTNPTTGGVTASYAMLGDVHLAEPGAEICFAGKRVIEQTIREKLPEGFQTSEYLLEHGMVDMVVKRHDIPDTLATLLKILTKKPANDVSAKDLNGAALPMVANA
jgi:acetyl-CoA carboxylase carboxyl transferase subunit beta